uniref:L-2-hydroxyglutarate dehydrogenase, mitochondrial n=1 Tax=Hemiscolopendra marginata TaxID=943146 RepID=A0A646QC81_9MYRI
MKPKPIEYDVVIVGGGIVGLATARELILRHPKVKFAVVEKENRVAAHQSGHNSGVIHCGIYYTPGSLKAKLCVRGLELSYKYFDQHNIPYKKCGKLIVAVDDKEVARLETLYERGLKNNVKGLEVVGADKIKEIEPHCVGKKAIWCPNTGIVDWEAVTKSYARDFQEKGGKIYLSFEAVKFEIEKEGQVGRKEGKIYPILLTGSKEQELRCRFVVTCGGLQADRLAELTGCDPAPRIVPFRGEYLLLNANKRYLVRGNIYPVPDPNFPFLGVHFTPRMNDEVWLGPNAVLAFKREGYKFSDYDTTDFLDALRFKGFQKLMLSYFSFGMGEMMRSFFMSAQVRQLRRYVPELNTADVSRGPAGVRAQAMSLDGKLVDDFVFDGGKGELGKRMLHVRNAPSPAATSSLSIAEMIADEVKKKFQL